MRRVRLLKFLPVSASTFSAVITRGRHRPDRADALLGGPPACDPEATRVQIGRDSRRNSGNERYYEFIDAILAPDKGKYSRKKREMLSWYGRPYDPDDIEEDRIKAELARMIERLILLYAITRGSPGVSRRTAAAHTSSGGSSHMKRTG
jgi:hypothetical protein